MCLAYTFENSRAKDGAFGWKIFEECNGRLYTPMMAEFVPQNEVVQDDYPEYLSCMDEHKDYLTGFHLYDRREDMRKVLVAHRAVNTSTKYVGRKVQYWDITATGKEAFFGQDIGKVVFLKVIVARKIMVHNDQ